MRGGRVVEADRASKNSPGRTRSLTRRGSLDQQVLKTFVDFGIFGSTNVRWRVRGCIGVGRGEVARTALTRTRP
ncbi:hypothetical protein Rcae01_06606 [Novipirellula caenicola]|uniref:Uncharacterized protein n=1 Tax=Novipirellula caenicola TaxID=1536901 RepID=A0ABP9W164_9BACT